MKKFSLLFMLLAILFISGCSKQNSIDQSTYSYRVNSAYIYKAKFLSEELIKIECYREYRNERGIEHDHDVCVYSTTEKFYWLDDEHNAFSIFLTDPDVYDLEKGKDVSFVKE